MKKMILCFAFMMAIGITTSFAQETTNATFGVRGNCGMCKSTIEKSGNTVDGLETIVWDGIKKEVSVSFDNTKTTIEAIHKAIANSGYDTDKVPGNEESYKNLPGCCQYDHTMEMSLKGDTQVEDHSGHNH